MPTATSSTEARGPGEARRALADVGHLVRFRMRTARGGRWRWAVGGVVVVTLAAAIVPALVPGAGAEGPGARPFDILILLPTAYAGFLAVAVVSAVASGGGRELLPHAQGVAFPVSPTTDHLGVLLLAPVNVAWILQTWMLLGATAYGLGSERVAAGQVVTVLWVLAATAVAQVVAWTVEGVRRGPHGIAVVRVVGLAFGAAAVTLWALGRVSGVLDALPTRTLAVAQVRGVSDLWGQVVVAEVVVLVVAVAVGVWPARWAARRLPRDEQRLEGGPRRVRPMTRSDLGMLVRLDRASVWRVVPVRRGVVVLAAGPGAFALAGGVPWEVLPLLPGLLASGGALLFGVNAWCLDGRGMLWRESLPLPPTLTFAARAWVLAEFLLLASFATLLLAVVRAGTPTAAEVVAVLGALVVVVVQVVAASLRWSLARPYAVDLRSARATPAPPSVMVGYSARLALATTLVGLVFSWLGQAGSVLVPLLATAVLLLPGLIRLRRARAAWCDHSRRATVVASVAA